MGYEISVGDYGRAMFECMVGQALNGGSDPFNHWESIRAEAEPLVRELIALNEKMTRRTGVEPYSIIGVYKPAVPGEKSKKTLSKRERISQAQVKLWGVFPQDLKVGDKIWINDNNDQENYILDDEPKTVDEVTEKSAYVDLGRKGTYKIDKTNGQTEVSKWLLRAPADFDEKVVVRHPDVSCETYSDVYTTEQYWLARAKELGI